MMNRGLVLLLAAFVGTAQAEIPLAHLREGGYVLYMRHASTDFSQNDAGMRNYDDCAHQRNLTDKGRAEARAVGEQVRRLRIPVGPVFASPFCRTVETARLAFGRAERLLEARGGPAQGAERYAALKKLMSARVGKGANRVIVSHGNPFHALAGPPYLAEGEIAIVEPGGSGFAVVGRIRIDDWQALE
jgi:phosphohistidine phosphatase SixA